MSHHTVDSYAACQVPLRRARLWDGIQPIDNAAWLVVHEGALPSISRIETRLIAKNRDLQSKGQKPYLIRKKDTGAYNCRKTTSGRSWSKHSWGCAADINWQTNPYSSRLITDMPPWFVQLWKDEGWGWGGNWSRVKDTMHFSKFPNEGGDGKLYVGQVSDGTPIEQPKPKEEDELTPAQEAKVDELLTILRGKRSGGPNDDPTKQANYGSGQDVMSVLIEKHEEVYQDGLKLAIKKIDALEQKLINKGVIDK